MSKATITTLMNKEAKMQTVLISGVDNIDECSLKKRKGYIVVSNDMFNLETQQILGSILLIGQIDYNPINCQYTLWGYSYLFDELDERFEVSQYTPVMTKDKNIIEVQFNKVTN